MAFVHLSFSPSPPTFTVKGGYNGTSGTAVFVATLSISGQAL